MRRPSCLCKPGIITSSLKFSLLRIAEHALVWLVLQLRLDAVTAN